MTSPSSPYLAEIIKLRYERDIARAELAEMRAAILPPVQFPDEWHLGATETKILTILSRRVGCFTKQALYSLLYGARPNGPDVKILDVFISKLRKHLIGTGIEIQTIWARGYQLSAGSHEIVARALVKSPDILADRHRGAA